MRACLALFGFVLLATGLMSAIALNQLLPRSVSRIQSVNDRFAWYFQRGQFQADLRTLSSAADYVVTRDSEAVSAAVSSNPPAACSVTTPPPEP